MAGGKRKKRFERARSALLSAPTTPHNLYAQQAAARAQCSGGTFFAGASFGFDNGSSLDSLLDKDEVSLEAILDEDDLLQECKSQNTRLIDYFQRVDVLQRLFGYVSGQIEAEDTGKFKYPYVSTEVLCSEIWSIVETCLNHSDQLLVPFWETVLDRETEDMKTRMTMATHFVKINAVFLSKKPTEMLAFIRAQPDVVERLLHHIETPAIGDLLVRIIQLDEQPGGGGVLEWLSEEQLVARLVGRLSPAHSPDMHTTIAELIKNIVSMAAPSPTAGIESSQIGPASNRFARELARKDIAQTLVDYMLTDFGPDGTAPKEESEGDDGDAQPVQPPALPNFESSTSSVLHSICIIIELIRQNNSDFFEPYLFHTLRNRLIHVQQQLTTRDPEEGRVVLESAMQEMVNRLGVVHLGPILDILSDRLEQLQAYLLKPRSLEGPLSTTVGSISPLTFERYRISELFAELLHCSNMALLNRPSEFDYLYDSEGRLQGGLSALEELARVLSMGQGDNANADGDDGMEEVEPAMELPVHSATSHDTSSLLDSDEDMSDGDGPSDEDVMEDISVNDPPHLVRDGAPSPSPSTSPSRLLASPIGRTISPIGTPPPDSVLSPGRSSPSIADVGSVPRRKSSNASLGSNSSARGRRSTGSKRNSRMISVKSLPLSALPSGERLKQKLLNNNVLSTVLDLFFDFPWNNFLHSVTYDLIHQILTGRVDAGVNRELAISLFRDAKLMHRIVEGQRRNDAECAKPKGVRLGYMGHLTLISEDVLLALEHFPPDLQAVLSSCAPQPDWDDYVHGRYNETKQRDTSLLGGGKPVAGRPSADSWKVDETDVATAQPASDESEMRGEFRRATNSSSRRESSADFGPAPADDDDDDDEGDERVEQAGHPSFARYLAQEMHSPNQFDANLGDSPDASDDEEDGGWLTHSQFDIDRDPPNSTRERRPLSATGFDDTFAPDTLAVASSPFADPFASEDDPEDGFGPFTDESAPDPFTFSSSFSDGMDSFGEGDFGEFHSGDGETTPTAGSWTFASGSSEDGDGEKKEDEERSASKPEDEG